jgi:hypothetical protein
MNLDVLVGSRVGSLDHEVPEKLLVILGGLPRFL